MKTILIMLTLLLTVTKTSAQTRIYKTYAIQTATREKGKDWVWGEIIKANIRIRIWGNKIHIANANGTTLTTHGQTTYKKVEGGFSSYVDATDEFGKSCQVSFVSWYNDSSPMQIYLRFPDITVVYTVGSKYSME